MRTVLETDPTEQSLTVFQ